ncbi:uncharacterized protein LOC110845003 isoform X2 [Folsomia candida]|uniref:Tubulin-specific chaperone B n=1 Tax=Folsomia candida TaxID=158441 RepID=A0A226ENM9_FOLCA|nr:uncharacterized protein LOC110845003 isoform X2 [Folsomia candida]OXA58900.1 Tubulin-specific chaperone B [Folsomia candida]
MRHVHHTAVGTRRRQFSMDETDNRPSPPPRFYHSRTSSEDRFSSISSSGSERGEIYRSVSQSSHTKRNFLRKRIVELKELDSGLKAGCRAVCFSDNPQVGSVKWVGKINQIVYIGIEFDNPIGTNFPETKGAPPFPCRVQHGKLVSPEDLLVVTDPSGKTLLTKENPRNFDTPLISTPLIIPTSLMAKEFSTKLEQYYEFCSKAEDTLDKLGEQLDQVCSRRVTVDPISITVTLERHKAYLNQVEDQYSLIDLCHSKSEELFTYADILLPSDERKINRTVQDLSQMHKNIERKLKRRIRDLEKATENCGAVQDLLTEKLEWLTEAKAQLRYIENTLIKTESQLASRLSLIEDMLNSFLPTESDEIVEILEKISQLHELTGNSPELDTHNNEDQPNNKFDSQLGQIIGMRNQLLDEIGSKYGQYKEALKLFKEFSKVVTSFEEWYAHYLSKVCDLMNSQEDAVGGGGVINLLPMDIVKEREEKRREFLSIFKIVGHLRVSIFDPAVLDDRLESLQMKWRHLMDVCYRDRFRQ